jgi:hypothetical protein
MVKQSEFPLSAMFLAFRGTSMSPVLQEGDLLAVEKYGNRRPRPGDVVLFLSEGSKEMTVHRISRIDSGQIHTRGDRSPGEDPWHLRPENIMGRVVFAWRGGKMRRISGGVPGRLDQFFSRCGHTLTRNIPLPLIRFYRSAPAKSLCRLLPRGLAPRAVRCCSQDAVYVYLLMGKMTVGAYDMKRHTWAIRKPFRLLVDEASLPYFN